MCILRSLRKKTLPRLAVQKFWNISTFVLWAVCKSCFTPDLWKWPRKSLIRLFDICRRWRQIGTQRWDRITRWLGVVSQNRGIVHYTAVKTSKLPKQLFMTSIMYSPEPHNDVFINAGPHIRRWSSNIIIKYYIICYNTYHCVVTAYGFQYSNMLYRFVACEQ
jgi:hypothetical protein